MPPELRPTLGSSWPPISCFAQTVVHCAQNLGAQAGNACHAEEKHLQICHAQRDTNVIIALCEPYYAVVIKINAIIVALRVKYAHMYTERDRFTTRAPLFFQCPAWL